MRQIFGIRITLTLMATARERIMTEPVEAGRETGISRIVRENRGPCIPWYRRQFRVSAREITDSHGVAVRSLTNFVPNEKIGTNGGVSPLAFAASSLAPYLAGISLGIKRQVPACPSGAVQWQRSLAEADGPCSRIRCSCPSGGDVGTRFVRRCDQPVPPHARHMAHLNCQGIVTS